MLTISDIYDALAARERPDKKAVPDDRAIDILRSEARAGRIDADSVELFASAKVLERPRAVERPGRSERDRFQLRSSAHTNRTG